MPNQISDSIIEAACRLKRSQRFAILTIIYAEGSTPRKDGSRMLVDPDGATFGSIGGGAAEHIAIRKALECLKTGQIERIKLDLDDPEHKQTGMVCGGKIEVFIEPFGIEPRLFIFGAGHVAQPTVRLANEIGFKVIVIDSRTEWLNDDRFPNAELKHGATDELAKHIETTNEDYIIVMTYSHDEDYQAAKYLLRKPFFYLGIIGSKRKATEIRHKLKDDGFTSDEIARMTCPIGIDIGSHTPEEIAVSVVAQLIQMRNK